jgi:hypothetical protein
MWRYLAGGVAALLMVGAGWLLVGSRARTDSALPAAPRQAIASGDEAAAPLPDMPPEATAKTREQKRFGRYDKDRNGQVSHDEYFASRRKAYAKLDLNGDGRLTFEEWSAKTQTKFAAADKDKSGAMSPTEFATTAVKRSTRPRPNCPPLTRQPAATSANDDSDDDRG